MTDTPMILLQASGAAAQETYGLGSAAAGAAGMLLQVSGAELAGQLKAQLEPLLEALSAVRGNEGCQLRKVKLSLGVTMEGKLFVASGSVATGLELEYELS